MPLQQIIPIWGGLNTANSPSATGLLDPVTGQQYNTGGLEVGDYFDLTEKQANSLSNTTTGLCHSGRYRYVQLDSGANVANVKTGTVGYLRAGSFVQNVVITTAGTGATTGTYTIQANVGSGGGAGASITVVVSGGAITNAVVTTPGYGYVAPPTFSLTVTGTAGGVVAAQLNSTPNIVTSADQVAVGTAVPLRPVVFLNALNGWTPGNYGFIQELGQATVLGKGGASGAVGDYVNAVTTDNGLVTSTAATGSAIGSTIGRAVDTVQASNLFKIYLGYAMLPVQD